MDLVKEFNKLCNPAKFYLVLSFVSIIIYFVKDLKQGKKMLTLTDLGFHVIFMTVWVLILNKVCSYKYGVNISWFLVLMPIVFMVAVIILMIVVFKKIELTQGEVKQLLDKMEDDKDDLEGFEGCGN